MRASDLRLHLAVDLVVLTLRHGRLHVLLVQRDEEPFAHQWALPGGLVRPAEDLADAAQRVLREAAGIHCDAVYLEQVRTFGAPDRDPRGRVVSVAFMALGADLPDPHGGDSEAGAHWWAVEDLDQGALAFDHGALLSGAVDRARAKLEYTTLAATFLPPEFTISQLRGVYESVWGTALDAGNFHRKATRTPGFVVELDRWAAPTGGRPARLYRAGAGTRLNPPLLRSSVPLTPVSDATERDLVDRDPVEQDRKAVAEEESAVR